VADYKLSEKAQKALRLWEEGCVSAHEVRVAKQRERYHAYRGWLDATSDTIRKLNPERTHVAPWVQHIVNTTLAGLVDDKLQFRITPAARFFNDTQEYERIKQGAKAHEILHKSQFKQDRQFDTFSFAREDAICGYAVAKTYWCRERTTRTRRRYEPHPVLAELGYDEPIMPVKEEITDISFDGPLTEVVINEDFYWHEAAVELQKALVIAHRVHEPFPLLKQKEADGYYQNVDKLKDTDRGVRNGNTQRVVDGSDRAKDMVEVLEIWWREDDGRIWTVTLGNQCVEIRKAKPNPFRHGRYPFVVCTTQPDRFSVAGISQVEKISKLAELHTFLSTQAQMNVELLNNHITIYDAALGDMAGFTREPGAMWPVQGDPNAQIMTWTPDPTPANIALPMLQQLEKEMQSLGGGQPFTSTSQAGTIGADTATEAALATNIAQRSTIMAKQRLNKAYGEIGQQRTWLNQQFVTTAIMVEQIGLDSQQELVEVAPYLLNASDYLFDVTPMNESLMRAEKRAEGNALATTLGQLLPIWVQLASQGAATMPNFDEIVTTLIENYELEPRRFFSAKPPAMPPGGMPGQPQQQAPAGGGGGGVTGPGSIDPSVSPSSALPSMSGESMMQQAFASRGAQNNT
jgi:hypothetical protein